MSASAPLSASARRVIASTCRTPGLNPLLDSRRLPPWCVPTVLLPPSRPLAPLASVIASTRHLIRVG